MDPVTGEQLDYGAIPALAEVEIGDDDEYDDLYNDVNVGGGFLQMQRSEVQMPSSGVGNGGFQDSKTNVPETIVESVVSQQANNARVANEGTYPPAGVQFPDQKTGFPASGVPTQSVDASQRAKLPEMAHISEAGHLGYQAQASVSVPQKTVADQMMKPEADVGEAAPSVNPHIDSSKIVPQTPANLMNSRANLNTNHGLDDEYMMRSHVGNGNTMLFVGELHWWTTDAELESILSQYGKVKEVKFFDERASGKSKGYCQVEFYDPAAAAACKEGMHGHVFNGRACVVAYANAQTIKQMGASYTNRTQNQSQSQLPGRNPINDGAGRGNGTNYPSGDGGRNYGRGGWGRGGNQFPNKGPGPGPIRGRGGMGNKNMMGNAPGAGGGGAYGQGPAGPGFGVPPGMMHPQGMMGPGFDLAFMGRGGGYGGFSGHGYPGMLPPYPPVNSMGLPGVAPHVNPAFFGRGMAPNGMGMMGTSGMDAHHSGMLADNNMGGWGGEEHGRGTRESSYGGEDNASEYGYGEGSQEKGVRSTSASREKERNSERDFSSNPEKRAKRHREERDHERDRYDRDHKYREEKDRSRDYRHKGRDAGHEDDWDKGQSSRSHSKPRAVPEDDHRSRSRDADYSRRRRMPSE
ncbi:hypothetical protein ACS0TY_009109 [Phlomoides rotata]